MLPLLSVEEAARLAREAGIDGRFAPNNIMRSMIHSPAAAAAFYRLVRVLAFENKVNPRYRELMILRLAWRSGSEYMFGQHMRLSRELKLSEEEILGVRNPETCEGYGELDRAVINLADELHDTAVVSPATWGVLEKSFEHHELVEFLLGAGLWRLAAGFLNSAKVPLDESIPRWPEGRAPNATADGPQVKES
jgi:alkylhydroperoxidase family enzyme